MITNGGGLAHHLALKKRGKHNVKKRTRYRRCRHDTLSTIVARPQTSGDDRNNYFDFIRSTDTIGSLRDDTHVERLGGGLRTWTSGFSQSFNRVLQQQNYFGMIDRCFSGSEFIWNNSRSHFIVYRCWSSNSWIYTLNRVLLFSKINRF